MRQIKIEKKFHLRPSSPGSFTPRQEKSSPFPRSPKNQQNDIFDRVNFSRDLSPHSQAQINDLSQSSLNNSTSYRGKIFSFTSKTSGWRSNQSPEKTKQQDFTQNQEIYQMINDKMNISPKKNGNSLIQGMENSKVNKVQSNNSVGRNIYFNDYQGVLRVQTPREDINSQNGRDNYKQQQNQLLEEDDFFTIKVRKSFRAAINHYCQNLEDEMKKIEKEELKVHEKKQSRDYCHDLAMKVIHLLTTEITPFTTTFNLLSTYCKSQQYCNDRTILRLYDNIKSQLEYEEKMKNINAEKQYELFLQLKKKEKFNQFKEQQQRYAPFYEISETLSSYLIDKCKDILINENRKKDRAFDNLKHLDLNLNSPTQIQSNGRSGNLIINKNNDSHRYSFLFSVDRKSQSNFGLGIDSRNNSVMQARNNSIGMGKNINTVQGRYSSAAYGRNNDQSRTNLGGKGLFQDDEKQIIKSGKEQNIFDHESEDDDQSENDAQKIHNEQFESDQNFKLESEQLDKKHKKSKHSSKKRENADKFSKQKDEFVINQILQEKFEDRNKDEEKEEREREEKELEEKLKNVYDMNLQGMITDIIQSEVENNHRALTDYILQFIEIIKQRFFLDQNDSDNVNIEDITAYVKETFVIQIEELQEKQISQLKQRFSFQIEILQKKCKQLRIQFLQSQKIQQYLYVSKTELYEFLKNLRSQTEDIREKYLLLQQEKDALEIELKDIQFNVKPNQNLYLKSTTLQAN